MAGVYKLRECWYDSESSFAENAESPSSNTTWEKRIPGTCTVSLGQERLRDDGYRERTNAESLSHLGIRTAEISITTNLVCHGAAPTAGLTQTFLHDLISDGLGGSDVGMTGTTASAATSATSFTPTATTGWAVGQIFAAGNKTESRGNGQCGVLASVGSPSTSLVALPGTLTNGDVLYSMLQAYHDESAMATLGTKRFMVGWSSSPTTGQQFQIQGCQLAGLTLTFPFDNTLPKVTLRYLGAYWARSAETIPSSTLTLEDDFAAPCAGGSVFINDVGTATRNTVTPSELELTIDLGLAPIPGPGGAGTYQIITGWQRTGCKPMVRMRIPYTTAYETWFDTSNSTIASKHMLFTSNGIAGRRFAFYCPSLIPVGNRPSVPVESNEQTYVDVLMSARDGATTTTELTKSAVRLAFG